MNLKRWIARREPRWRELEALLARLDKQGLRSLTTSEIQQVASLYRSVSADLARAQTHAAHSSLVRELQALTARAYGQVYRGQQRQSWRAVLEFYVWDFPAVVQETWMYWGIATAVFVFGIVVAWWYAWQDPTFIETVVPPGLISQVRDDNELWMGSIIGNEPWFASGIMVNNIIVSFRLVSGGITLGLLTLFILFLNGINIGVIATLVGQNGLAFPFWAFVFPHGSLELPAIFLAGGAGLLLARALLFPGQYRRRDAFKVYGKQAAQLVSGIVPMLVVAGIIEGFFSPSDVVPSIIKYTVGATIFTLFVVYCGLRRPVEQSPVLKLKPGEATYSSGNAN